MSLLNMNTLRLHNVVPGDPQEFANSCQKKKFIVKAQLPISKKLLCVLSTYVTFVFCIINRFVNEKDIAV